MNRYVCFLLYVLPGDKGHLRLAVFSQSNLFTGFLLAEISHSFFLVKAAKTAMHFFIFFNLLFFNSFY